MSFDNPFDFRVSYQYHAVLLFVCPLVFFFVRSWTKENEKKTYIIIIITIKFICWAGVWCCKPCRCAIRQTMLSQCWRHVQQASRLTARLSRHTQTATLQWVLASDLGNSHTAGFSTDANMGNPVRILTLNTISDNPGAKRHRKRIGRGVGSGRGKTAGKGHKGQKPRRSTPIHGFEGGA